MVVVESPAKSKTIKKYLGAGYTVLASYGHVRDLLPKEGAVDPAHDFAMRYQIIDKNSRHVDAIVKALKNADTLYLATDPDREGEAISWHLCELLREKGLLDKKSIKRVVFHEITKGAVNAAIAAPRDVSMDLVNAQQARRALDYLVGFNLSPLLWKKIRRGLSAGRVQSPALRLIVEREEEIEKFQSQEYWRIEAEAEQESQTFHARLVEYEQEKIEQFSIVDQTRADAVTADLQQRAKGELTVTKVEKKQRKRHPAAPFITSTLQQEAVRKLGFTAQRAMRTAQQLYEGIDIGGETVGLITYMRTDSVHLAQEAVDDIRGFIGRRYGEHLCPSQPRVFKTKSKNAQEAHEAIRPTSVRRTPEQLKDTLSADQWKLYSLIWKRTVASQMVEALIDTVAVDLQCGPQPGYRFRANGSSIAEPGFISVYQEDHDDKKPDDGDDKFLPNLSVGTVVNLKDIHASQHFTEPPPRYSEASLVKALEEFGIGRPSTYASIISTLQNREYVEIDKKRFIPTDVGRVVNRFLTQYFQQYVDYNFTANLEDELDAVSRGEKPWIPLMSAFWETFKPQVEEIDQTVQRKDVTQEAMAENCPQCQAPLAIRLGRRGRFVGCTAYPDCDYTRNLNDATESTNTEEVVADRRCPECDHELRIKVGKYGKFIGCSNYPKCRFIESLDKPKDTGVACPHHDEGTLLQRRSKRSKIFYSCSKYPKCQYAIWNEPIAEPCPRCGWPVLTLKTTKSKGTEKVCPQASCSFSEAVDDATDE